MTRTGSATAKPNNIAFLHYLCSSTLIKLHLILYEIITKFNFSLFFTVTYIRDLSIVLLELIIFPVNESIAWRASGQHWNTVVIGT